MQLPLILHDVAHCCAAVQTNVAQHAPLSPQPPPGPRQLPSPPPNAESFAMAPSPLSPVHSSTAALSLTAAESPGWASPLLGDESSAPAPASTELPELPDIPMRSSGSHEAAHVRDSSTPHPITPVAARMESGTQMGRRRLCFMQRGCGEQDQPRTA
jgi:hypothetical protein